MKKIFVGLLVVVMVIAFVGCNKFKTQNNKAEQDVQYSDDQVLFAAQDRCDVEEDRYNVYSYNYNGELLDSFDSSGYIGYYAENGLAPAANQNTGKVGFVDKDGVFQIEPKYADAAPFSKEGIALVKIETENNGNYTSKCGYINSKGEEIIPCIYDKATSFFDCGYALALTEKNTTDEKGHNFSEVWKHYIIDKNGDDVITIDVIAEERKIIAVYKDYFVCTTNYGEAIFDFSNNKLSEIKRPNDNETQFDYYYMAKDCVYKNTYEKVDEYNSKIIKTERFNGEKFIENKKDYEITSKPVATTQSGLGYGMTKNDKTVIPFEYDQICEYGEYFVAIKYTGNNIHLNQTFDIYDKNFNKTAENIKYAFSYRGDTYGLNCQLPNGYFQIIAENDDYESVNGIIDYTGKVIVEPVFGRGIRLYSYEGMGAFDW